MPCWVRTMPRPDFFQKAGLGPTNSWRKAPNWYQPNVLPAWIGPGAPCTWSAMAAGVTAAGDSVSISRPVSAAARAERREGYRDTVPASAEVANP